MQEIKSGKIGIIAGNGPLPKMIVNHLKNNGCEVFVVAHVGETKEEDISNSNEVKWVNPGKLKDMIQALQEFGVYNVIFAGGLRKARLFKDIEPDKMAVEFISSLPDLHDDTILRALAIKLEKEGFGVLDTTFGLGELLGSRGIKTYSKPTQKHLDDVKFGFYIAKSIGALDIGQTVVVEDHATLAIEAIEGTDEAILRAGNFSKGEGVVVKVKKPNQDVRFDLPSIGPSTLKSMKRANLKVIAYEAYSTIVFEGDKFIRTADELDLVVCGVTKEDMHNG